MDSKKPSFWQRLFGGAEATTETVIPQADAQGNISFSAEQFGQLTTHLESLDAKEQAYTQLESRLEALEGKVTAHGTRLDKVATLPAVAPAASSIEPVAVNGDVVTEESEVALALKEASKTGAALTLSV